LPTYIYKADPDVDLYVAWSTVVDNMTSAGTRAEMLRDPDITEDRLIRADETGTSCAWQTEGYPREGAWDDEFLHVMEVDRRETHVYSWRLRRSDLLAYAQAYARGDDQRAEALLLPNRLCQGCDREVDGDDEWQASGLCQVCLNGPTITADKAGSP
jgi:hypothetical protein